MKRGTVVMACALAALTVAPAASTGTSYPVPGADAAAKRTPCQKLRGNDLAPSRKVKLVERPDGYIGVDLMGCVLPGGKVRRVTGAEDGDTSTGSYSILGIAGGFVAHSSSSGSQYGSGARSEVMNLRSGRSYSLASWSCGISDSMCPPRVTTEKAFLTSDGRAVVALSTGGATTTIASFTASGERTELDTGPAGQVIGSTLRLSGDTITWMGTGGARTAQLTR